MISTETKKDFHMHPNILKKPYQADEFIARAIELGFDTICFTDHMPFTLTGDEHDRIPFGRVGEYCSAVREKADEYKSSIHIKTGIEIDYHPKYSDEIEQILGEGKFDYVIGSSHMNIVGFKIPMDKITRTEFAGIVLNNYLSAAKSGYFDAISHLDVYRWVFYEYTFSDSEFDLTACSDIIEEIFEYLEKSGVMLELNAAPLYKKFDSLGFYPEFRILNMSKKYKIKYIYGSDAHTADKVGFGYNEIMEELL